MIIKYIIGAVVGAAFGLGYYQLVGCPTGACPLTRNPWITTIYGAVMGVLVATSFR